MRWGGSSLNKRRSLFLRNFHSSNLGAGGAKTPVIQTRRSLRDAKSERVLANATLSTSRTENIAVSG
jgi:hypothetical protein